LVVQTLPSIEVPPIEGCAEQVKYKVSGLDLGHFHVHHDNVEVVLGDVTETGDVLTVTVGNVKALLPHFSWSYEQTTFPFVNGQGFADAEVAHASVGLHTAAAGLRLLCCCCCAAVTVLLLLCCCCCAAVAVLLLLLLLLQCSCRCSAAAGLLRIASWP
jgi:hypothetical protein